MTADHMAPDLEQLPDGAHPCPSRPQQMHPLSDARDQAGRGGTDCRSDVFGMGLLHGSIPPNGTSALQHLVSGNDKFTAAL
jgi:hypothetical protein